MFDVVGKRRLIISQTFGVEEERRRGLEEAAGGRWERGVAGVGVVVVGAGVDRRRAAQEEGPFRAAVEHR